MQKPEVAGNSRHLEGRIAALTQYELLFFGLLVVAFAAVVLAVFNQRAYISFLETDFITFTIPDAARVLNGEPMKSLYHPPVYALTIAMGKALFGEWLKAGLAISLVGGVFSLLVSFALFRTLAGKVAGWGAALALLGSSVFMGEAMRAGSDLFFLGLFLVSCWLAVLAMESRSPLLWFLCGLSVGLSLLTRSNALPLLLLIAAPFLDSGWPMRQRLKASLQFIGGLVVPLIAIAVYAQVTGSRVLPLNNLLNLGLAYFSESTDRSSFDAAFVVVENYEKLPTLFLSDRVRILGIYINDLYNLLRVGLPQLLEPPMVFFIFPGIFILFTRRVNMPLIVVGIIFLAEIMLINLKYFEPRYYLFLVPMFGSAIALSIQWIVLGDFPRPARVFFAAVATLLVIAALGNSSLRAAVYTIKKDKRVAAAVDRFGDAIGPSSAVIARKPHIPFYTDSEWVYLPNSETLEQLKRDLTNPGDVFEGLTSVIRTRSSKDNNFVFFGEEERKFRPKLEALSRPEQAPEWLEVVATGDRPQDGTLYRIKPLTGGSASGSTVEGEPAD